MKGRQPVDPPTFGVCEDCGDRFHIEELIRFRQPRRATRDVCRPCFNRAIQAMAA